MLVSSAGALVLVIGLVAVSTGYLMGTGYLSGGSKPLTAPTRPASQTSTGRTTTAAAPPTSTTTVTVLPTSTATGSTTLTVAPSPTPSRSAPSTDLRAGFAELRAELGVRAVGLAYAPVGDGPIVLLGDWRSGPAWSTIKVPLSLAALRRSNTTDTRRLVHRALTVSDNQAAEALWSQLGAGRSAADDVDAALTAHGDRQTRTQAEQVRPPYTPFGQTAWSLAAQVRFGSALACTAADRPVLDEMSHIVAAQRWGLGRLPGAAFKGGWGPDPSGRYLVRQFGVVRLNGRLVAVAIAVQPASGSFDGGIRAMDLIADWVKQNVHPNRGGC